MASKLTLNYNTYLSRVSQYFWLKVSLFLYLCPSPRLCVPLPYMFV